MIVLAKVNLRMCLQMVPTRAAIFIFEVASFNKKRRKEIEAPKQGHAYQFLSKGCSFTTAMKTSLHTTEAVNKKACRRIYEHHKKHHRVNIWQRYRQVVKERGGGVPWQLTEQKTLHRYIDAKKVYALHSAQLRSSPLLDSTHAPQWTNR